MPDAVNAREILRDPIHFLAFGFGSGLSPIAPGTMGTLAAIPLYYLLIQWGDWVYLLVTIIVTLIGILICDISSKKLGVHDHSGIVWDEIAGYFITMLFVPHTWYWVIAGFALFRLFDIWKPFPILWFDQHIGGGLGIMLDDVLAAIYAGLILLIMQLLLL
ncbi:MAG TPA: phosphatidylglycerophosphatase A [Thiothrix sp.]|nr:phosphatidylglycerophosphatase A [Thiothrix sp.]